MVTPALKQATYQDILDLPEHVVGEIVGGVLHASPRPAASHARATTSIVGSLSGPFDFGGGNGPGGWILLVEPELHLGADVLVPDIAGWRREKMPELPAAAAITIAPTWLCEVLSPSTARLDRAEKLPAYAAAGVDYVWLVDPLVQTLEVFERQGATWNLAAIYKDDAKIRAVPFDAVEFDLGLLWRR